jgi:GTP-dependent phosphoenolpyruvate carboxykinase
MLFRIDTPPGRPPSPDCLDGAGLDLKSEALEELLEVDIEDWLNETELIKEQFHQFGDRLPEALNKQLASTGDSVCEGLRHTMRHGAELLSIPCSVKASAKQ